MSPRVEETLAKIPIISCDRGQLTITADDATVSSVFIALERCLGIQIKVPASFIDERTFVHFGPGPTSRVLDDFLGTTDLNYAIVLSHASQPRVTSVVLTSRVADSAESSASGSLPGGGPLTNARKLWMASQASSGRPVTNPEEADGAGNPTASEGEASVPATRGLPEHYYSPMASGLTTAGTDAAVGVTAQPGPATAGTEKEAAGSGSGDPSQLPAAGSAVQAQASSSTAANAKSGADTSAENKEAGVLGRQIDQMQQLIEQRRKLNAGASPQPTPAPGPAPQ